MSLQRLEGSANDVNDVLRQLFHGHGVEAGVQPGRVTFPAHPGLWANGELFAGSNGLVQLDVRLGGFDGDRVLIESICGFGPDVNAQASFVVQAFANASFHVFLPAFFGRPPCHGTERETWTVGGGPRAVYAGLITTIFGYPPPKADGMPDLGFYPAFIERLKTYPLPPGTHWVRIYQMRFKGQVLSNEVLLDNAPWAEMQGLMAEQPWPVAEKPYDVRVFLVIKDAE
jgi:hypothetical protein